MGMSTPPASEKTHIVGSLNNSRSLDGALRRYRAGSMVVGSGALGKVYMKGQQEGWKVDETGLTSRSQMRGLEEVPHKFTAAKIKEQIKKILQAIEKEKSRYRDQNLNFIEVKPQDIERKLKRMKSPMIIQQIFSGSAPEGGTINYNVGS
jgi:hypothetical protein